MGKVHQQQAKQPSHALTRPAPSQTVGRSPASPQLHSVQSAYGNQAVNRLLESRAVQAKMTVTPPSDSYEQEAEHVADQVTRMSEPASISGATPQIHRLPENVSRAAKADAKDDKKKGKEAGGKKKEDGKVKRAAAKDDKKDDKKKKPEDDKVKRAEAKDDQKDEQKKDDELKRVEAKNDKKKDAGKDAKKDDKRDKKKDDDKVKRTGEKDEKKDSKKDAKKDDKKKDDDKVKRAAEQDTSKEDDEDNVQRASAAAEAESVPDVTPEIERSIQVQRSSGEPLPQSMRTHLEPRFGRDLSNVRLHTDSRAAESAKKLKAQAFTHGQDIYFAQGRYQPQSDSGKHLLAHEITHTLQQSGGPTPAPAPQAPGSGPLVNRGAQPGLVQRDGEGGGTPAATPTQGATGGQSLATGMLDGDTITFDSVDIPGFKLKAHRAAAYAGKVLKQKKGFSRGNPQQRDVWKTALSANTEQIQADLKTKAEKASAKDKDKSGAAATGPMAFEAPGNRFFIGDLPTIAKEMTLPYWSRTGNFHRYDVDHILELQLADWDGSGSANEIGNMELLDPKINQQSGVDVKNSIGKKVKEFIDSTNGQYGKNVSEIKKNYNVVFQKAAGGLGPGDVGDENFWEPSKITDGTVVKNDKITPKNSVNPEKPDTVYVFPSPSGGVPKSFPSSGGSANWPKPFKTTSASFETGPEAAASPKFGVMEIEIPANHEHFKPFQDTVELTRIPGAQFAGVLDKSIIKSKLRKLEHKKASPIEVGDLEIDPEQGLVLSGAIKPDLPILEGKQIDFELSGNDITISMELGTGDLKVPKPFVVKDSTIKIFASSGKGLGADGRVDFGIERVGEGFLAASVGTSDGLNVAGEFNFDSKLFKPAKIDLSYENKQFKASGELGIPEGKVTGIKTAKVAASYDAGTFKASGTAELTIPSVKKGDLDVEYSEAAGFKIGGDFTLDDKIPGLKGGSAKVGVEQGEAGYKVKADITAQPAIPGVDAEVKGSYYDGTVDLSASATYARGIARGKISIGATNRTIDDDGKPSGQGGDKFSAYGSGEVTLKLTEWLQGTVGVKIKPDAEMELKGKLGLPSSIDVFPKKEVKQTLFSVNTPIPIFPPIIAEIGGALEAKASFGPGQLKDLSVEVTYNPDKEDDTIVEGKGAFVVPADAGLALSVHGGIGASVAIASLTGGIDVGGELGIQGKAQADVDVNWTPKGGVDLKAEVSASAEPKFVFKVNGYVRADVGIGPLSYTLYEHKWNLASFEYGSNLHFGVTLPIHYNSKENFDIKFEDIHVEKPEISTDQILHDLLGRLT
jgi:hypothetical protein